VDMFLSLFGPLPMFITFNIVLIISPLSIKHAKLDKYKVRPKGF
jgi:hypothetical protein